MTATCRRSRRRLPGRRRGVILLVVLALLTLLALVGLSFVFYSQTLQPALAPLRDDAEALVVETVVMSTIVGRDLRMATIAGHDLGRPADDDIDFSNSFEAIATVDTRLALFQIEIERMLAIERDPLVRQMLESLLAAAAEFAVHREYLASLIESLDRDS